MFGSSNTTPFGGGGGFGQQQQTNQPNTGGAFGQSTTFGAPSAFGQPAPAAFGQQQQQPSAFGANPTNPAPLFGNAPQPAPAFGGGTTFGSPTPAPAGPFGAPAGGAFGAAPAPTPGLFGAPAPAPNLFGQAPATTPFGSPAPAFGGAAPASTFGAAAPTSTFGAPSTTFGAPAPGTTMFGAAQTPAPNAFGSPAPAFGAQQGSTFGQQTGAFGAPSPSPSLFGSTTAPATTPATAFGGASSGGIFGASSQPGGTGQGTRAVPYQVTAKTDGSTTINLQSVVAMPQFESKSPEELRVEDYLAGNKNGTTTPVVSNASSTFAAAPTPGIFGGGPTPAPAGAFGAPAPASTFSAFGTAPQPATTFGGGTSTFGSPAPSAFGNPAPAGGMFGQQPAPAPSLFGGSTQPAPAPFGAPASTGMFGGQTTNAPAFGASPTPGLFGQTPGPSTSAFGAPAPLAFGAPAPATFGAPAPNTLFGAPAPAFGSPSPAPLWGQQPQTPASQFGAPAATPFGTPGQATLAQPMVQPLLAPNAQIIPPGQFEALDMKLKAIEAEGKKLDQKRAWQNTASSPVSTPTSQPDTSESLFQPSRALSVYKPRSAAKIHPRGFTPKTEPPSKARLSLRDHHIAMTPDAYASKSFHHLHVKPESIKKITNRGGSKFQLQLEAAEPSALESSITSPIVAAEQSPRLAPILNHETPTSTPATLPPKSPHREYFDRVIGREEPLPSPFSPVAASTGVAPTELVPMLTKPGYEIHPTLMDLEQLSEADLAAVTGLTVSRPGFGMVEWEGSVDVRGANLDRIVCINDRDISVYADDEEQGTKPAQGSKLNRPATLTFYGVYPKGGPDADDSVFDSFHAKLQRSTIKHNAEFLGYDRTTGVWKIRVLHFSKYGWDDEEGSEVANQVDEEPPLPMDTPLHLPPTPKTPATFGMNASRLNLSYDEVSREDSGESFSPDPLVEESEVEQALRDLRNSSQRHKVLCKPESQPIQQVAFDELGEEDQISPQDIVVAHRPTPNDLYVAIDADSLCSKLRGSKKTSHEVSKGQGASFRAGWAPNGTLQKISMKAFPAVEAASPVLFDLQMWDDAKLLLEVQRDRSKKSAEFEGCPIFSLPQNDASEILKDFLDAVQPTRPDAARALELVADVLSPYDAGGGQGIVPLEVRKHASAQKLLRSLCVDNNISATVDGPIAKILQAVVSGNTALACNVAVENSFFEIAAILATSHTLKESVSELANFLEPPGELNWSQTLLNLLQSNPDSKLVDILNEYEAAVKAGTAPFPSHEESNPPAKSLYYQLLRVLSDPTGSLCALDEAVAPAGYSTNPFDYGFAYHLVSAIVAACPDYNMPPSQFEKIADSYVAQLLLLDEWDSAVFVTLYALPGSDPNHRLRVKRAKDLVLRYYRGDDIQSAQRNTLERLGVPSTWFSESLSYRASSNGDFINSIEHMLASDPKECQLAFQEFLLPRLYFEGSKGKKYIESLAADVSQNDSTSLTSTMRALFDLDEFIIDAATKRIAFDSNDLDAAAANLQDIKTNLSSVKQSLQLHGASAHHFLLPAHKSCSLLSYMVNESLGRCVYLEAHLDSIH